MKQILPGDRYLNFLALSVGIRILLSPNLLGDYVAYAEQLLHYFASSYCVFYGRDQMVYNVHSIIHLAGDARKYGSLHNISSFKFESYLGRLKTLIRKPQQPCLQIVRRILDGQYQNFINTAANIHSYRQVHTNGPLPVSSLHCSQFQKYNDERLLISTGQGDNLL